MKQLKFSFPENLPALLQFFETEGKEGKNSTMRKAYEIIPKYTREDYEKDLIDEKPPEFKVGEVVEAVWSGKSICTKCFVNLVPYGMVDMCCPKCENLITAQALYLTQVPLFYARASKILLYQHPLGKVRIKSVEKIEVRNKESLTFLVKQMGKWYAFLDLNQIAKSEGFQSVEQMFKRLEEWLGDLSTPKPLWRYTYEYVGD